VTMYHQEATHRMGLQSSMRRHDAAVQHEGGKAMRYEEAQRVVRHLTAQGMYASYVKRSDGTDAVVTPDQGDDGGAAQQRIRARTDHRRSGPPD
jgi:hypothetical protein